MSTTTSPFTYVYYSISGSNSKVNYRYVDIQLDFEPRVIIVSASSTQSYNGSSSRTYTSILAPNEPMYADANYKTIKMSIYDYDSLSATNINLYGSSSEVDLGNGIYRIPMQTSGLYNIRWVAYE